MLNLFVLISIELDPSDSGLPSLNGNDENLASWICLHSNNFSHRTRIVRESLATI